MRSFSIIFIIVLIALCTACVNDLADVKALTEEPNFKEEVAKDVKIFYSDSAKIKVIINAPTLKRHTEKTISSDEFPDGIYVEFMGESGHVTSWLEADYAVKSSLEQEIVVRENVKFYNKNNDMLETSELNWDESTGIVHTDKFVKITQPSRQDTSYGFGLVTNEEFSRFEIEKFQGVKNADQIKKNIK